MAGHDQRKHALLSASGAARWLNCTPSARLEDVIVKEESSIYAKEGTLAHEIAELLIQKLMYQGYNGPGSKYDILNKEIEKLQKHELYKPEMVGHVSDYADFVLRVYAEAKKVDGLAELHLEERTDYTKYAPEGFGTSDANIVGGGVLHIADLKYGKGVKVDAENNSQLKLYALGMIEAFDLIHEINTVRMSIVQPRLNHFDTVEISRKELEAWGVNVVRPAANLAYSGKGDKSAGSWCKWCKVKATCRALADKNLNLAKHEFATPSDLTLDEIGSILSAGEMLSEWLKAVKEYAYSEAMDGRKVKGFKLVHGTSRRKWIEEAEVIKGLKKEGLKLADIQEKKLKSISEIEKNIGSERFKELGLTIRPSAAPALVPESSNKIEIGVESAKKDFEDDILN